MSDTSLPQWTVFDGNFSLFSVQTLNPKPPQMHWAGSPHQSGNREHQSGNREQRTCHFIFLGLAAGRLHACCRVLASEVMTEQVVDDAGLAKFPEVAMMALKRRRALWMRLVRCEFAQITQEPTQRGVWPPA